MLGDDFAGLDEFGSEPKQQTRLRKLVTEEDGATPLEQLKSILSVGFKRVLDLFREWDDDGSQTVSKTEFRQALPVLGLLVDKEVADSLFDTFDADRSGEIDYQELSKQLRQGADVELDDALKDGAVEIQTTREQKFALRTGLEEGACKGFGGAIKLDEDSDLPIVEQLQRALGAPGVLMRAIDIFRAWDDDDSGTISRKEFAKALPAIGLKVTKEQADELFSSFDDDDSGSIDYSEIQKKLRKRLSAAKTRSPRLPKLKNARGSATSSNAGSGPTYSDVREAVRLELETKRMLSMLKRRLNQAEREEIMAANAARKAAIAEAVRLDIDRRVGRDLTAKVMSVTPASVEECREIAALFHEALAVDGKTWFNLFNLIDEDGSGRISYAELKRGCRNLLHLSQKALPDSKLQAVWRTLDEDASGFISTGEFGAFMKMAPAVKRKKAPPPEKQKLGFEEDGDHSIFSKQLVEQGVEASDDDEFLEMSRFFNMELNRLPPNARSWYTLFRKVDEDSSGLISYQEFENMVRSHMRLTADAVPRKKLHRIWLKMDEDLSGQIDSGEFGHFMNLARRAAPTTEAPTGVIVQGRNWRAPGKKQPDVGFADPKEEEEMAMAVEVERARQEMERMKLEAAKLEQMVREKESRLSSTRASTSDLHEGGETLVHAPATDGSRRTRTTVRVKASKDKTVVTAYGGQARRTRVPSAGGEERNANGVDESVPVS